MAFEVPKNLKPIVDFAIHIVFGTLAFAFVFGAAGVISLGLKAADDILPHWAEAAGEYAEMFLFGIDLLCFGLFILSEAIRLVRGLWKELRQ